jgi:hypothetical protein
MNNNFLIHIIRDVFGAQKSPIVYGRDFDVVTLMKSNEHSMGAVLMYSDFPQIRCEHSYYLNIDQEDISYYRDYCDFMLSVNYQYQLETPFCDRVAKIFSNIIKKNGKIFLVNPGTWSFCFDDVYERNFQLEREVKRFSLLRNEKVFVYENI